MENITLDDIQTLIENSVCENKNLDYKRELHIDTDSDKKEFLADISSFANSNGGDIIFGIEEDSAEKIPTKIVGIHYENDDVLVRKLEDFIRQSIQPIILNIEYKVIEIVNNKCILIIRIPQSLIAPHRVEYKGYNKFFTRNNKGKYQMDVNELRLSFNSGIDLEKRIEDFKMSRYYEILSNKYNKLIADSPIFVIHYIPLSSLNDTTRLSINDIRQAMNKANSMALGYGYSKRITLDGIAMDYKENERSSFALYKNNGIIEKATTNFFKKEYTVTSIHPNPVIDMINEYQILNKVISDFNEVKEYYITVGINAPIIITCAILNAQGFTIPTRDWYEILGRIDRDVLLIDNLYVENLNDKTELILKPLFDAIYNACGYESCLAYDSNGDYIGLI
mgnify:CR=1 FL=1